MKSNLKIIGNFLTLAIMLAAGIAVWNQFPSGNEKSLIADVANLNRQLIADDRATAPLLKKMAEAQSLGDEVGYLKNKVKLELAQSTQSPALAGQRDQDLHLMLVAETERGRRAQTAFYVAMLLTPFAILTFILSRRPDPSPAKANAY